MVYEAGPCRPFFVEVGMVTLVQKINNMIEPAVIAMGYELVGCELQEYGHGKLLRVYVDGENGITIDGCAKVSRQVSAILDVEDPLQGAYKLEVSSPGLDRPLFTLKHFEQFVGRNIKFKLRMAQQDRRNFMGLLTAVEGNDISVKVDNELMKFDFNNIEKTHLVPEF